MVMKGKTLWRTEMCSSDDGQDTKRVSIFGTTMGIPFRRIVLMLYPQASLYRLFLSHTTSPPSFKTIKGKLPGVIKTVGLPPNQRVMASL